LCVCVCHPRICIAFDMSHADVRSANAQVQMGREVAEVCMYICMCVCVYHPRVCIAFEMSHAGFRVNP